MLTADDINAARFWAKVKKTTRCWHWRGARDRWGYGRVCTAHGIEAAHRVAYVLTHGAIPPGACVLHSCDHPNCVNPRHLRAGSHQENIAEAASKGRMAHGERHCRARLTDIAVQNMRALRRHGIRTEEIAAYFGVSTSTAMKVISGRRWRHVSASTPCYVLPAIPAP